MRRFAMCAVAVAAVAGGKVMGIETAIAASIAAAQQAAAAAASSVAGLFTGGGAAAAGAGGTGAAGTAGAGAGAAQAAGGSKLAAILAATPEGPSSLSVAGLNAGAATPLKAGAADLAKEVATQAAASKLVGVPGALGKAATIGGTAASGAGALKDTDVSAPNVKTPAAADNSAELAKQRERSRASGGRASNILTTPLGRRGSGNVGVRTLLGN